MRSCSSTQPCVEHPSNLPWAVAMERVVSSCFFANQSSASDQESTGNARRRGPYSVLLS